MNPEDDLPKSKSQIKREMTNLQDLGARLITLSDEQLRKLNLPPLLQDAVKAAKKITSHGAKRRQLQYIGRLMRDIEDPSHIEEFFLKIEMKDQRTIAYYHMLESWRERLIAEEGALTEFIELYPNAERQHLRQLVQNAKKERLQGKPVGAAKALFRYLRELQERKQED